MLRIVIACIVATLLAAYGCATTDMVTYVSPSLAEGNYVVYKKVFLYVPSKTYREHVKAEEGILEKISDGKSVLASNGWARRTLEYDVEVFMSHKVFRPDIGVDTAVFKRFVKENEVDALLAINIRGYWSESSYLPIISITQGKANPAGQYSSTTTSYGGYAMSRPVANIEAKLYDLETGELIWLGSAETRGDEFSSSSTLWSSFIDKMVESLEKHKIIVTKARK